MGPRSRTGEQPGTWLTLFRHLAMGALSPRAQSHECAVAVAARLNSLLSGRNQDSL